MNAGLLAGLLTGFLLFLLILAAELVYVLRRRLRFVRDSSSPARDLEVSGSIHSDDPPNSKELALYYLFRVEEPRPSSVRSSVSSSTAASTSASPDASEKAEEELDRGGVERPGESLTGDEMESTREGERTPFYTPPVSPLSMQAPARAAEDFSVGPLVVIQGR